jgi:hypothetical protein
MSADSVLVSEEYNRLRGRLAGLIESWGVNDRQERGMIQTMKQLTYDSEKVIKELVDQSQDPQYINGG